MVGALVGALAKGGGEGALLAHAEAALRLEHEGGGEGYGQVVVGVAAAQALDLRDAFQVAQPLAARVAAAAAAAAAAPTPACPIRIVVVAALDNKDEPHDLPIAPWA